ncbi:TrgA family protein [Tropicibacter naphthalenivorans]|uniref:Tellurium resistance protein n=1 Tax=Tropicibacter naphthalenivorans TaxID=441103 RepID=A0A0P1G573_9RHOB|nr:TrgA family protein [Tropicibacter naphthalenivorans]CUH76813.1 hypothetical protein TRN7648_01139 [Tropicibacter naphthalenivorans]SMC62809.1 hypothetical protein SAMN04488093_102479 [Tropicibacter naphthalenivorans]
MPTAAKLFSAICLVIVAYVTSEFVKAGMPASRDFGLFSEVNAAIGGLCGWFIVGPRAGRGVSAAIANGFTGTAAALFWCLFVQSANEMVDNSFDRKYRTVVDALMSVFEIAIDFSEKLVDPMVILTMLVGGIITGLIAEKVSRHWR